MRARGARAIERTFPAAVAYRQSIGPVFGSCTAQSVSPVNVCCTLRQSLPPDVVGARRRNLDVVGMAEETAFSLEKGGTSARITGRKLLNPSAVRLPERLPPDQHDPILSRVGGR